MFHVYMGCSAAPEVFMLKRFRLCWQFLDRATYETGMCDEDDRENLLKFAASQLQKTQPTNDYWKLLLP